MKENIFLKIQIYERCRDLKTNRGATTAVGFNAEKPGVKAKKFLFHQRFFFFFFFLCFFVLFFKISNFFPRILTSFSLRPAVNIFPDNRNNRIIIVNHFKQVKNTKSKSELYYVHYVKHLSASIGNRENVPSKSVTLFLCHHIRHSEMKI